MTTGTLRGAFLVLLSAAICMAAFVVWWALTPSTVYLQQTSIHVEKDARGWIVTSVRELPYGDVTADYRIQMYVLRNDGNFACSTAGTARYTKDTGPVVRYRLNGWARECIEAGPPISMTWTRSVRVFYDLIPLRPFTVSLAINPGDITPVQSKSE